MADLRFAVAAVAVLLLAGCAGNDAEPGAGTEGADGVHGRHDAGSHLLAPEWALGDWWTWSSPQIEGAYTSVLARDLGTDWSMATDHPTIAFFDARFDIASLGQVRKGDLAGSQGSTRVQFFQFPLTPERTWTTTWDGQAMTVLVTQVKDGVASLEARRSDGTLYAAYTYRDGHGYFGGISYYDAAGEAVGFEAQVTSSGKGYAGDLVHWDYDTVVELSGAIAEASYAQNLPVPLTATDVYAELFVECTAGAFVAGVAPLPIVTSLAGMDDRGVGTDEGACPLSLSFAGPVGEPRQTVPGSTEEQWGFSAVGDPSAAGTFTFNLYVRTMTLFKVGEAPA